MENRHSVLLQQLEDYRKNTLNCVENITEEEATIVPEGFNNNIKWNLGHIYVDQFLWIQHLTKEKIELPEGFLELFNYGTKPSDWSGNVPSLDQLKQLLIGQIDFIKQNYADTLEEEFQVTESGMHTMAQVLVRTIFHEGLHLGAIIALKRFIKSKKTITG
ncbi:DinB family protein [Peribacillus sp. SCS-155]|uniref:DinB family protein n=1 Tax=Peribacillus sedimenti TaxID=3115297 RepID=UPI003906573C